MMRKDTKDLKRTNQLIHSNLNIYGNKDHL